MTPTGRPEPGRLPAPVAAALAAPEPGRKRLVDAAGYPWRALEWGDPADPPILLVHGITSNAETFWRVGPAVAAAGRFAVAVDLPGHGETRGWRGRHRIVETATDLASFIRAARLDRPRLTVLGHSWGAMVVANLPVAGLRPAALILLDPPVLNLAELEAMTHDPSEQPAPALAEAIAMVRQANPGWTEGDVQAKALGLTQFEIPAVRSILLENGAWDGGLAAMADSSAAGVPVLLIRGTPAAGGLTSDRAAAAYAARIGAARVITIPGAPHSPQRTHPEATIAAILRGLA